MKKPEFDYTEKQIEALMMGVYMDFVNVNNLPKELYFATANYINAGLYEGFGGDLPSFGYDDPDYKLLSELRRNNFIFSGAKTYQQYKALNRAVYQDNEKLSYKAFKEKAMGIFDQYNDHYLKTEWETAITSATTAKEWQFAQEHKQTFTYLRYSAVIDARTTDICRALDGITLPVDHKFWHTHVPPQHFNCRCILEHIDKYEVPEETNPKKVNATEQFVDEITNPVFKMNPGIDKYVFSPKHPYFKVAPDDRKMAEKNFKLPIPKKDPEPAKHIGPAKKVGEMTYDQKLELKGLPRIKGLTPEDAKLQEQSLRQFVLQKDELATKYLEANGNTINTDEARKLFKGYKGHNAAAVHEASSALVKIAADRLIKTGNNNLISMYAGGAGSGKTSSIEGLIKDIKKNSDAIIDGNLASYSSAYSKIDQYLGKGKAVDIHYAYRDPMDAWENGVIKRMLENAKEKGRVVPLSTFMENTTGSLAVTKQLKAKFAGHPFVKINTIDNSLGKGKTEFMSPEKFDKLSYPKDLRDKLLVRTHELLEAGKITKKQYEALIQ